MKDRGIHRYSHLYLYYRS